MSEHIDRALLQSFVQGELGERTATHVARHLDDCAACAQAARALDSLTPWFASASEPALPDGLVASVLAASGPQAPTVPWFELGVGATLLATAALAAWSDLDPAGWWSRLGTAASGLSVAAEQLRAQPGALAGLTLAAIVAALGTAIGAGRDRSAR